MIKHTIIVDNFFINPDAVRVMALNLKYYSSNTGVYSGRRTDSIHISHKNFYDEVCKKILSYYNLTYLDYTANMHFHITGKEFGECGWVHQDGNTDLASIVYLNPSVKDINSGTSIFNAKVAKSNSMQSMQALRKSFITGEDNLDEKINHNLNYEKTIMIGGVFNRLVSYPGTHYHAGEGYFGTDTSDARLTLLTFFSKKNIL